MKKPSILDELELIGREVVTKGNRIFTNSWLSGGPDKNPSVLINTEKDTYYDFSCGQFGDSYDIQAFRKGISRTELISSTDKKVDAEVLINIDAKNFFRTVLEKTETGRKSIEYVEKRGLNKEIREKLEVGMTYKENVLEKTLIEIAKAEKKYAEYDVASSPLFHTVFVGNKKYVNDCFKDRLMFPIKNEIGEVVGFTGRTLNNDNVKYLNTVETKVFKKKEFLFNINNALASIRRKKQVFIVEGPFDVVAYLNVGVENVVSALTCNVNESQIIKLLSLAGKDLEFVLAFDNDKAGSNGIKNCMELFKQFSIWNYKVVKYSYKDASEYIENDKAEELKKLLDEPLTISEYLGMLYNKSTSLSLKSSYVNTFVSLIYTFPDFVISNLVEEFNKITDNINSDFVFELYMNKKQSSEILKYILYHLKNDKREENVELFNLMVNDKLLTKKEKDVITHIENYKIDDYKNSYKLSNLITEFIKRRVKEKLAESNPF